MKMKRQSRNSLWQNSPSTPDKSLGERRGALGGWVWTRKRRTQEAHSLNREQTEPRGPSDSAFSSGFFSSLEPAQDK